MEDRANSRCSAALEDSPRALRLRGRTIALGSQLLAAVCLVVLAGGCGETSPRRSTAADTTPSSTARRSTTATAPPRATRETRRDGDNDYDNPSGARYDSDDSTFLDYGNAANASDRQAIANLVKRYYTAAATNKTAAACSLLFLLFEEEIVEDYSTAAAPASLRASTCPQILAKVFALRHGQLVAENAGLAVVAVRVHHNRGYALFSVGGQRDHEILVHREFGTWKIGALFESGLG